MRYKTTKHVLIYPEKYRRRSFFNMKLIYNILRYQFDKLQNVVCQKKQMYFILIKL